jgi:DNA polymerase III gamma/tau subunit
MLYQIVRPSSLEEVVGNEETISALSRTLKGTVRPHVFLLHGPFGCGKTTLARIMATTFGSTESSTFLYNAANTRGIETVREVIHSSMMTAVDGSPKTFIFDESHQLTPAAQEALLDPTDEPPEDVYYIFCTTAPKNLIKGIRSRCTEYSVQKLTFKETMKVLQNACEKMEWKVDEKILEAVAMIAKGCSREALVSLEMVHDETDLDTAIRLIVKGTEKDENVISLGKMLLRRADKRKRDWKKILELFYAIEDDPERLRKALLSFMLTNLRKCDDIEDAEDIAGVIRTFSVNVYYGGKGALAALVVRACFGDAGKD